MPIAVAIAVAGCLVIGVEARHSTFTGDDWSFILQRRGLSAGVFLRPHNEHLSALPILAYKVLLAVFGLGSYIPFVVLLLVLHGITCVLLYAITRRYVGPWVALAPTAIFAVLGPAWNDLLWAFQIGYLGSVAAGLGMVLCLERRDRNADVGAGILLGVSLLCSSIGVGMVVFGSLLILLQRPVRWRRLTAVAVPVALYLLWYAFYGVSGLHWQSIPSDAHYVFRALSAALASITGLGGTPANPFEVSLRYGRVLALAAVVALIVYLIRGGRPPAITWAALATAVVLWVAQWLDYVPGRDAAESRYQYTAAALVLIALCAVASGWRPTVRLGSVLAVLTVVVCGVNIQILHNRTAFWSMITRYDRSETGALEIAKGIVADDFSPDNPFVVKLTGDHFIFVITAGPYFSAVRSWGSPAYSPQEILAQTEAVRVTADLVLGEAERVNPAKVGGRAAAGCRRSGPRALETRAGKLTVSAGASPAAVRLRRFATSYGWLRWSVPAHTTLVLSLPRDRTDIPWHISVAGTGAVCAELTPPAAA